MYRYYNHIILLSISFLLLGCQNTIKTAYLVNEQVFEQFVGTKELSINLESLRSRHKSVLDSIAASIIVLKENPATDQQKIEAQQQLYEQLYEGFSLEENKLSKEFTDKIWVQINQYVEDYGEKNEYTYIFGAMGNGVIMYAQNQENITENFIEYANSRYMGEAK